MKDLTDEEIGNKKICPNCGSINTIKGGIVWKNKQRFICKDCWKTFTLKEE